MNSPRSAYVHIPFCHKRCFYCDFAIVPLNRKTNGINDNSKKLIESYLDLIHREIHCSSLGPPLATVYIGGGTPSLLSASQISSLIHNLSEKFGIQDGAEITLEVDPASFTEDNLDEFIEVGINRFSLGGQSFSDDVLSSIGRTHSRDQLIKSCQWIHDRYMEGSLFSWSLDLIQNLPSQNLHKWQCQLDEAIKCSAPHLSIYDLTIEPGTVFAFQQHRGE